MMDKTCTTWSFETCDVPTPGGCDTAYVKTLLAPIKVTASTAKLGFVVPRASTLINPLATGWTLSVKRGGSNKVIATYTIAEYDSSKSQAIFFLDDAVRNAAKGYYYAEVKNDCCVVAKVVLHVDCGQADSVQVFDFTHDPQPVACADTKLKPAVCAAEECPAPKKLELAC
jgi:hypothetical protein